MSSINDPPASPSPSIKAPTTRPTSNARPTAPTRSWLALPPPLKHLFSLFPLRTLPASPLPARTASHRSVNTLHVFSSYSAAANNAPSFNPTCLKWQTYLKFLGVKFQTVVSTNHASPTGVLPFLLPASSSGNDGDGETWHEPVVASNRLVKWVRERGMGREEMTGMRYEAYMALLDHRIRRAWLYTLYLSAENFKHVAYPLYITPTTSSSPVRHALSNTLQAAALAELLTTSPTISPETLYEEADGAFEALSTLLGGEEWFFGADQPGLFDASVFAYTYLLVGGLEWRDGTLGRKLKRHGNLIDHARRVESRYYPHRKEGEV